MIDCLPMHSAHLSSVPERYENSYTDLILFFLGIRIAISVLSEFFLTGADEFVLVYVFPIHIDTKIKVQFATKFK